MRIACRSSFAGLALLGFGLGGCAAGHEQKVAMTDVPQVVRATLKHEAPGTVTESEKETEHGKVVYEFRVAGAGGQWKVHIAEDGTLLEKKLRQDKKS